jgi:hypothetical protein
MSKVICVDNSARPESIPLSYWVKKDDHYTIINSFKDMNGVDLVEIAEINLRQLGTLYKGFAANRFRPLEPKKDKVKEEQLQPEYA